MKGTVYKYTFSDGKVYIGKSRHAQRRMQEHFDKNAGKANPRFYDAYKRLGEPKYEVLFEEEFDSLLECEITISRIEEEFIYRYKATNPDYGYNVLAQSFLAPNTIKPLRTKICILSEELLQERLAVYNCVVNKLYRTKEPLTKDELYFVKEKYRNDNFFQSIIDDFNFDDYNKNEDFELEYLLDEALPCIKNIIQENTLKEVREYVFRNADEILKEANRDKIILKISPQGNVIGEYDSINDICEELNIARAENIRNVLRGKQKTAYGYVWKYKKDFEHE